MKVREIMSRQVTTCIPETSLQNVARLMDERDIGSIPVVEANTNKLLGIVTDRDIICRAIAHGRNPQTTQVRECMSNAMITAEPEMSLEECCQLMENEKVRRLPVVDASGSCCGIIAQADIARQAPEHEVAEVVRDISQPAPHDSWAHTVP